MESAPGVPTGVKELIHRLRDEGVRAGREEADRLVAEARKKASEICADARAEAEETLGKARSEIQSETEAAKEAIRLAFRDTELKIKAELRQAFAEHVRRLVAAELEDEELLRRMILLVAGRAAAAVGPDQQADIIVDEGFFEEGRGDKLTEKGKESVDSLILGLSRGMLRDGVEIKPGNDMEGGGIRIQLVDEDLEIDLRDEVLSDLLISSLTPRYRAIVQGD